MQWLENDAAELADADALSRKSRTGAKLDGIWLNAGYAVVGDIDKVDAKTFDAIMAANVSGPVLQLSALIDLLNDGASIVMTASTLAYEGAAMASL